MVADSDGRRYVIPRWTTDPEAAEWNIRDVPRLSRAAMSELHGLVAMILRNPVSPETGFVGIKEREVLRRSAQALNALQLFPNWLPPVLDGVGSGYV